MKPFVEKTVRYFVNWVLHRYDRYDGSYHPSKKFKIFNSPKDDQDCIPEITVDSETGNFQIAFGKGRNFNNGHVEINYNKIVFSSLINSANPLEKIKSVKNEENSVLGDALNYTQTWKIPNTDIIFETTIMEFKDSQFIQFELNFLTQINNISTGSRSDVSVAFPVFTNQSINERLLTFKDMDFSPPLTMIDEYSTSPVCIFDDNRNAVLFSALNPFSYGF